MDAASGFCIGCGRTLDEIARWSALGESDRQQVMQLLPDRLAHIRHCGLLNAVK
jgi:predicted Fe-S protein YdhL (DUF1289 family)